MTSGTLVMLLSEEEIVWDSAIFEWDHTLLFPTRENARDMAGSIGNVPEGTIGTILQCDPNYIYVLTPYGIGWSRKHYWKSLP